MQPRVMREFALWTVDGALESYLGEDEVLAAKQAIRLLVSLKLSLRLAE